MVASGRQGNFGVGTRHVQARLDDEQQLGGLVHASLDPVLGSHLIRTRRTAQTETVLAIKPVVTVVLVLVLFCQAQLEDLVRILGRKRVVSISFRALTKHIVLQLGIGILSHNSGMGPDE